MRPTLKRVARLPLVMLTSLALLLGLGGCAINSNPLAHHLKVVAYFTDTPGVFVGNDVGVLGVTVGKITSITPDGNRVKVTMSVDADQPVPAGAAAVVVPRSVATDRYIELTPVYRGGARMKSGAVIPLDRTRVPVEFDEVLGSLNKLATGIGGSKGNKEAIRRALDTLSRMLGGHGKLMNQSIRALSKASEGLSGQRGAATSTLLALDKLTQTVHANQSTVRTFIKQVAAASSMLAQERGNFRDALTKVTRMIRVVARFARQNRAQITATVRNTDHIMRNVLTRKGKVAEILREMPLTVQNLARVIDPKTHTLRVRLDITKLVSVLKINVLQALCNVVGEDVCSRVGLDPTQLVAALQALLDKLGLGNLLGGKQ